MEKSHSFLPPPNSAAPLGNLVYDETMLLPSPRSQSVRPDLAKFRHFGTILKVFGKLMRVYLVFGKSFKLTLAKMLCCWASFHCCRWPHTLK